MSGRTSVKRRLRLAAGDVRQILTLVHEAERLPWPDKKDLGDVYAVAMNSIGPLPLQTAPDEYGELCVKRLQVLCHVDPQEARTFNNFLAHYGIRQEDPRLQQALAVLSRDSVASVMLAGSPPPVRGDKERLDSCAPSRSSFTPLRPRNLSYSSADTTRLEEVIAAVAASALSSSEQEETEKGELPEKKAEPMVAKECTTREFSRVSIENLSPIPEDREKGTEPLHLPQGPPGEVSDLSGNVHASEAAMALCADNSGGSGNPKSVVVNGVSYTRLQTIGRGGTSKVYRVRSPNGMQLALKRVTASCPKHFEALANEVTLLQQLKDSQNIIQVLDAEVLPERLLIHIVMEEGQMDLGRLLQAEADITLGEVQVLWKQMLEAVQVVHSERVVHSDLKPGNFLLVKQSLKLIDFGIAKRIASNTTNISRESSVGTISYMAPEAVKQGAVKMGRPSDIWSLGIILYQMVYMKAPFAHLDPMQRLFALTDPSMVVEFPNGHRFETHSQEVKDQLLDVLQRCLQREPSKRPTIPELLEHPFLASETIKLSRASFDRTMEALVRSFVGAAEEAIASAGGPAAASGTDPAGPAVCWQVLADEAWKRLSDGSGGWQAKSPARVDFTGLAPFREWLARGFKRQRVAEAPKASAATAAAPNAKGAAPGAAAPPLAGLAAGPSARQAPVGTKPRPKPSERRAPLHQTGGPPNAKGDGGRPAIQAELLQKQRTNLRKATGNGVTVGKENVAPSNKDSKTAGFAAENLVLKRLKNRRALLADDKAEDEQTDTYWGH
mmetsp:Transcript_61506/g.144023  ORF Transcript_61506/g.144023 Transcript_61506/m.144023 type:complete len:782 (-) Transcript_61506:229-2574(-)